MSGPVIDLDQAGQEMLAKLSARGAAVDACYQCLRCAAGCPMLPFMDIAPNRVVRMVQYGLDEQVLSSGAIWMCASCQTCTARCPNEVDIAHMMDVLRQEALRRGVACREADVKKFHRAFVREVRRGRVHELSLIGRYKLATRRFMDDMKLGWRMFLHGRIKLFPHRVRGADEVKALFEKAERGESPWT